MFNLQMFLEVKPLENYKANLAEIPEFRQLQQSSADSASFDLLACLDNPVTLWAGCALLLRTGIALKIRDPNYAGFIYSKSGKGFALRDGPVIISAKDNKEICLRLLNTTNESLVINNGDPIGQIVFAPVMNIRDIWVTEFIDSPTRNDHMQSKQWAFS